MLARLIPLLLLVLGRDGVLHRFDGHHDTTARFARASGVTVLADHRVAVLADERALAAGDGLWTLSPAGVSRVDLRSGTLTLALVAPHARLLAADGPDAFTEVDGELVQIGAPPAAAVRRWKVAGRAIALAAGGGKLYVATKAGPLLELDRATGTTRDLGLGDWWGTVALAWADGALYAVTVAGKLWRIDPARPDGKAAKTIVAMDGFQGAIDLSVLR
jgi:hypothetical protein